MITLLNTRSPFQVLVDGPSSSVPRCEMRLNELHLTKFRLRFPFSGSTRVVRKAWQEGKIDELWKETMWARKVEAKKKVSAFSGSLIFYQGPWPLVAAILDCANEMIRA